MSNPILRQITDIQVQADKLLNCRSSIEEIQEYAKALKDIMLDVFPETTKLWQEVYWDASK